MNTLERRISALEAKTQIRALADHAPYILTDEELAGAIQLMKDRGEWNKDAYSAHAQLMTDAELSAVLMPLVEAWRGQCIHLPATKIS